jgi:hypothetical protein
LKELFQGYYIEGTEEYLSNCWQTGLLVLDTNVLLEFYRYPKAQMIELLAVLNQIAGDVWLPHQVALEYHRNRLKAITQQIDEGNQFVKDLAAIANRISELQEQSRTHPFTLASSALQEYKNRLEQVISRIRDRRDEYTQLRKADAVRDSLTSIFCGKVGPELQQEELVELCKGGEIRYDLKIPPGFGDDKKQGIRRYGDLIIWRQLIAKAKEMKQPIVFVTNDIKKDDWWVHGNSGMEPHPELVNEMYKEAGVGFWMHHSEDFWDQVRSRKEIVMTNELKVEIDRLKREQEKPKYVPLFPISPWYPVVGYSGMPASGTGYTVQWAESGDIIYSSVPEATIDTGIAWTRKSEPEPAK